MPWLSLLRPAMSAVSGQSVAMGAWKFEAEVRG